MVDPAELGTTTTDKRICKKFRSESRRQRVTQKQLAVLLRERLGGAWPQSRVWKLLWNQSPLTVAAAEVVAEALHLRLADLLETSAATAIASPLPLLHEGIAAEVARYLEAVSRNLADSNRHLHAFVHGMKASADAIASGHIAAVGKELEAHRAEVTAHRGRPAKSRGRHSA